ncbi:magnesium-dependent phosphatase-1 [Dendrothele bispora CBS 962.96]|uniref:Magnesium-dependent phosphatase-1 n=1 Tax=Dendrothele bispora (strain CBS 962.96) TaxID=1314807 RepID=A0A4V6T516_DENBC|nr:magnesium-dependent phosphatase-1 [Dendrothele bispora CBS 962.96]THU82507.1 magnesium-dependent phosphatase-1 [Dendrothele bispora CBS 962.96]
MTTRYPKLVAFDLDYTLWDLWIDTHVTGPLHRDKNNLNEVLDRHNEVIAFYKHVPQILHRLRAAGVTIAAASRTSAPNLAHQALNLLLVPPPAGHTDEGPTKAIEFFDRLEIYPGSKLTHFRKIHQKTGIPYNEMLFFDDEYRNKEVEQLGITMQLVRNGMDNQTFEKGIAEWKKRNPVETVEDV